MTTETQLTGSEKQIAWATEIRTNLLAGFADLIAVTKNAAETARQTGSATEENIQKAIALVESRISDTLAINKASWWIDNKSYSARAIVGIAMRDGYTK
jgi:hypothetical protein